MKIQKKLYRGDSRVSHYQKPEEKNIILVSHGDPIMIYRYKMEGKEISIKGLLDGKEYIPKSGIIMFEFDNSKLLNIKTINYSESSY